MTFLLVCISVSTTVHFSATSSRRHLHTQTGPGSVMEPVGGQLGGGAQSVHDLPDAALGSVVEHIGGDGGVDGLPTLDPLSVLGNKGDVAALLSS